MAEHLTLPTIPADANKFSRGSLLVLAGSRRYSGAGILATLAAERTGAGYVSLAAPTSAARVARQHLICSPVIEAPEDDEQGSFTETALPAVLEELRHVDAICAGPGLTVNERTEAFLKEVLLYASREHIPLLMDADALGILAAETELMLERQQLVQAFLKREQPMPNPLVLTPHEGELARLQAAFFRGINLKAGELNQPALLKVSLGEAAQALSEIIGVTVVAKGPTTYIAGEDELAECNEATPALAKAGTGDVLAGIISSLLAQGITAFDAALLGVRIHSLAGVLAEQKQGRRSVTALDVIEALPQAVLQFES